MIVAEKQETNNKNEVETAATAPCYYSHNVGVTFKNDDGVAKNPRIVDALANLGPDDVTVEGDYTTFSLDTSNFAHFMHCVYCDVPEGKKLVVEFDGIYPFLAPDTNGVHQKFNAQLVTIKEVNE